MRAMPHFRVNLAQDFDEVEPTPSKPDDLLNFSIDGGSEGFATPAGGRAQPLSTTSASWEEEMNAELAEFDQLTGGLLEPRSSTSSGGGERPSGSGTDPAWEQRLDAELQAQLASPDSAAGPERPPRR